VHEDAELLEHVVSDRLIERMDVMLGHPTLDPHGDPIPTAEGAFEERALDSLLTCPLHTPVTVARISDQDAAFLRFVETSGLKPGQSVEVQARNHAADSVSLVAQDRQSVTLGTKAAAKLLVEIP
jgi:DtxR family Mn-dependent transcriptional regulator